MGEHSARGIAAVIVIVALAALFWKKIFPAPAMAPLSIVPDHVAVKPFVGAMQPTMAQLTAGSGATPIPYDYAASPLSAGDMTAIQQASYFGLGTE